MSTKIYNGLIYKNATLEVVLGHLFSLRQICVESACNAIHALCAKEIAYSEDLKINISLIESEQKKSFKDCFDKILEAQEKVQIRGVRSTKWDYSFEICLIPHQEDILALYYIENDLDYRSTLINAGFEDFHYQNSTDRPSEINEVDWAAREEAWNSVLKNGANTPGSIGLTYSIVGWDDYRPNIFDNERILELLPAEDERRKSVASTLVGLELAISNPTIRPTEAFKYIRDKCQERSKSVLISDRTKLFGT